MAHQEDRKDRTSSLLLRLKRRGVLSLEGRSSRDVFDELVRALAVKMERKNPFEAT